MRPFHEWSSEEIKRLADTTVDEFSKDYEDPKQIPDTEWVGFNDKEVEPKSERIYDDEHGWYDDNGLFKGLWDLN